MQNDKGLMGMGKGNEIVTYSYPLDDKRDTFARLVASGKNVGEAYNLAFHSSLPQEDAVFRAKGLCENEYVVDKINQYYDDKKVLTSINRQNVAIPLKRILDCDMSDFYEMDKDTKTFKLKPIGKWTRSMKTAFRGIKYTRNGIELQVYDKISAANSLMNLMGWTKSPDNNAPAGELSEYTDAQLKELASNIEEAKIIEEDGT